MTGYVYAVHAVRAEEICTTAVVFDTSGLAEKWAQAMSTDPGDVVAGAVTRYRLNTSGARSPVALFVRGQRREVAHHSDDGITPATLRRAWRREASGTGGEAPAGARLVSGYVYGVHTVRAEEIGATAVIFSRFEPAEEWVRTISGDSEVLAGALTRYRLNTPGERKPVALFVNGQRQQVPHLSDDRTVAANDYMTPRHPRRARRR